MSGALTEQRRRVIAAEIEVAYATAALSAPSAFPKGTLERFAEAEDRHEALVNAEAALLRERAALSELEKTL